MPPTDGLPLSAEALARLASAWSNIPSATERNRVVLHYLSGKIQADMFLPLTAALRPGANPDLVGSQLQTALAGLRVFASISGL